MLTAAPRELVGRGADGQGVGYFSTDGSWSPVGCGQSSGVSLSGTYFACAPSTATSFGIATTCVDGSVLPNPNGVFTCPGICCSVSLIVESVDPSVYMAYACGICIATLFRDIPSTVAASTTSSTPNPTGFISSLTNTPTSPPTSTPSTQSSATQSSLPSSSPGTSPTSSSSSSTSPPSSEVTPPHSSSPNHTWIAGAVVGPLVALAIIAGLGFWIWKLKHRKAAAVPVQERIVYYDPSGRAELEPRSPPNTMQEVPNQPVYEAPDARYVRELPGSGPGR